MCGEMRNRNNIYQGMVLLGLTGILIGVVLESAAASIVAGILGGIVGGFVGWIGGRRYLLFVCFGVLIGAGLGTLSGDRDILIIAAGTGGAIAGFIGAQLELFLGKK